LYIPGIRGKLLTHYVEIALMQCFLKGIGSIESSGRRIGVNRTALRMTTDLHCHSTASDGALSPSDVVARAHQKGVATLALTDHDITDGLAEAAQAAKAVAMRFIPGVEVSVSWQSNTLHVLGLGIGSEDPTLAAGLREIRERRMSRGERIANELSRLGIEGSLEAALNLATHPSNLSRMHFARVLVDRGYARDVKSVFKQFLSQGKPGFVPQEWVSLDRAVSWIKGSGGVVVLAHPGRYTLSQEKADSLIREFKGFGGDGIELLSLGQSKTKSQFFAEACRKYQLCGSLGSDFHSPHESRVEIGRLPGFPDRITSILSLLND